MGLVVIEYCSQRHWTPNNRATAGRLSSIDLKFLIGIKEERVNPYENE
jgi:hypothetical protein